MKIVVIGGSGLIGTRLVNRLCQREHEVIAASPRSGVNTITGEGMASALSGAQVVIDASNSPTFEDKAVLEFFEASGRNLLVAEAAAGVRHHVALSVVGTERLQESGYFRAKSAQENLVKSSPVPFTIARATQFFEFLGSIAEGSAVGQTVPLPSALIQPIAVEDAADVIADIALAPPVNEILEIAGPERIPLNEIIARYLEATHDPRPVVFDPEARFFGASLNDQSLTAGDRAHLGATRFEDWLQRSRTK